MTLNGGGTKIGINFSDDGTALCRSDISFGYKWDGSQWNPITTQQQLPRPAYGGYADVRGVTDIQVAPSDNQRMYCYLLSAYTLSGVSGTCYLYKSIDGGQNWTPTNWPTSSCREPIDGGYVYAADFRPYKRVQKKFGIDPANPDVVYASNASKLPQVTFDGGVTWGNVPDLPSGVTGATISSVAGIEAGGSGGTNGSRTVTLVGGTNTVVGTVNVTISGGAITSVGSINNAGTYSVIPDNPVTVSDAGLTGAKLNIVFGNCKLGAVCWTFDRSGGTTTVGGKTVTKNIYVAVEGSGVWRSTDGGVSFSQISASVGVINPTYCDISPDGVFYLTDYDGSARRLNRYNGSWAVIRTETIAGGASPGGGWPVAASKDVNNPGLLICMYSPGSTKSLYYSPDYGNNWTAYAKSSTFTINDTDSPWYTRELKCVYDWENTHIALNPASPNDLWVCWGQGIVKTTLSYPPSATVWNSISTGLETSVCDDLVHESGATGVLQNTADLLGFWRPKSTFSTAPTDSIMPSAGGTGYGSTFFPGNANGQSAAIDPYNPTHMVSWGVRPEECAYSLNGGATWTAMAGAASRHFSVGVLNSIILANGVILLCDFDGWFRSTDWGSTWTAVGVDPALSIPTSGAFPGTGWGSNLQSVPSKTGCPDGIDPNTFYLYNSHYRSGSDAGQPTIKGTYRSTDGGQNFTYLGTVNGVNDCTSDPWRGTARYAAFMRCAPGTSGHLFICTGFSAPSTAFHPVVGTEFKHSIDGGANWLNVTGMMEVNAFGFGKTKPGGSYASLCVAGFYNGVYGLWVTNDLGVSWTQLISTAYGPWPITNDKVQVIDGDKDIYGRWYIGFQGSGAVYSDLEMI